MAKPFGSERNVQVLLRPRRSDVLRKEVCVFELVTSPPLVSDPWTVAIVVAALRYPMPDRVQTNDDAVPDLVAEHTSWVEIVLYDKQQRSEPVPDELRETFYKIAGHVAADLLDEAVLPIYVPESNEAYANEGERTAKALTAPEPLQALCSTGYLVAVVAADDPELVVAEAEARRRWPEFVEAFKKGIGSQEGSPSARRSHGGHLNRGRLP